MQNKTESEDLSRAISFVRQDLYSAFDYFVSGQVKSVSAIEDQRSAQEAMALLEYLRKLAQILLPLTKVVPEYQDTCLLWLEHKTTRVEGEKARKTLSRIIKTVEKVEGALCDHLSKPPPFAPSSLAFFVAKPASEK